MTKEQICILIAMAVYMIAVVVIGVICARRNRTADDFYLGGRKLGPLVTAMSAEASDMSSWLLMGLPGVSDGYIRRGLDGHRPGSGYICQLVGGFQAAAPLYGGGQKFHHLAGFLFQPVRR